MALRAKRTGTTKRAGSTRARARTRTTRSNAGGGSQMQNFPFNKQEIRSFTARHFKIEDLLEQQNTFMKRLEQWSPGSMTGRSTTAKRSTKAKGTTRTRARTGSRRSSPSTLQTAATA